MRAQQMLGNGSKLIEESNKESNKQSNSTSPVKKDPLVAQPMIQPQDLKKNGKSREDQDDALPLQNKLKQNGSMQQKQ